MTHPLGRWLPEVDPLVQELRGWRSIRFDLEKVSARAGVSLEWRSLQGGLQGLTVDCDRIVLSNSLTRANANFTFAHELGHVFRRRGHFAGLRHSEEEWFADWFAREMLLPHTWLRVDRSGQSLAALHVDRMTVALQLAAIGSAPEIMRYGHRVLCRVCGVRHHRWGCSCRELRCAPAVERELLPEAPPFFRPSEVDLCLQLSIFERESCISTPSCSELDRSRGSRSRSRFWPPAGKDARL